MVQIEQLQERLQGFFTPSYISNSLSMAKIIYVTKEECHVMVEHEVHVDIHVLEEAILKQEGNQAHDLTTIGKQEGNQAHDGEDALKIFMGKSSK